MTGMSGTGKSAALRLLGARGHRVVDTDTDHWSRWVTLPDGSLGEIALPQSAITFGTIDHPWEALRDVRQCVSKGARSFTQCAELR